MLCHYIVFTLIGQLSDWNLITTTQIPWTLIEKTLKRSRPNFANQISPFSEKLQLLFVIFGTYRYDIQHQRAFEPYLIYLLIDIGCVRYDARYDYFQMRNKWPPHRICEHGKGSKSRSSGQEALGRQEMEPKATEKPEVSVRDWTRIASGCPMTHEHHLMPRCLRLWNSCASLRWSQVQYLGKNLLQTRMNCGEISMSIEC
jgi:hypothetical protein